EQTECSDEKETVNATSSKRKKKCKPKEIDILREENAELKDKFVRLQAEFDNYRKRMMKERANMIKTAGEDLLVKMLPLMDDFDRALEHINKAQTIEGLKEGVELIATKMQELMKQNGVSEIEAKGEDFDTDLHEAVTQFPGGNEQKGKVIDVAEKGYKLHDKVIRFSKVVVGV
ncbi:MAG: nucleotide exchange factor GrpE, partial [Bacteroidales bacterium]|nr:nucleotide exchange factor GrpE [Bacteroidales bacterium]